MIGRLLAWVRQRLRPRLPLPMFCRPALRVTLYISLVTAITSHNSAPFKLHFHFGLEAGRLQSSRRYGPAVRLTPLIAHPVPRRLVPANLPILLACVFKLFWLYLRALRLGRSASTA